MGFPFPALRYPRPDFKLAKQGNRVMVWDELRGKYLVLSPEEWVRQHLLHYLRKAKGVPLGALRTEEGFRQSGQTKRTDILVIKEQKAKLLVECKAPSVRLEQSTFDQATRYNRHHQAPLVMIANGWEELIAEYHKVPEGWRQLKDLPSYVEL